MSPSRREPQAHRRAAFPAARRARRPQAARPPPRRHHLAGRVRRSNRRAGLGPRPSPPSLVEPGDPVVVRRRNAQHPSARSVRSLRLLAREREQEPRPGREADGDDRLVGKLLRNQRFHRRVGVGIVRLRRGAVAEQVDRDRLATGVGEQVRATRCRAKCESSPWRIPCTRPALTANRHGHRSPPRATVALEPYMWSGAAMPSRSRPWARTRAVRSLSASRLPRTALGPSTGQCS